MGKYIGHQTLNCVVCGERATNWSGHVHRENKMVTAGYCNDHRGEAFTGSFRRKPIKGCQGCVGKWLRKDGLITEEEW